MRNSGRSHTSQVWNNLGCTGEIIVHLFQPRVRIIVVVGYRNEEIGVIPLENPGEELDAIKPQEPHGREGTHIADDTGIRCSSNLVYLPLVSDIPVNRHDSLMKRRKLCRGRVQPRASVVASR